MTATDSSHLEPDLRRSESGPTQHPSPFRDDIESPAASTELAPASAASPIVKGDVPDSSPAESEDKPRATRVAEGAWLGGVCTGLARHLGWPLMVVRIAFVALARITTQPSITYRRNKQIRYSIKNKTFIENFKTLYTHKDMS